MHVYDAEGKEGKESFREYLPESGCDAEVRSESGYCVVPLQRDLVELKHGDTEFLRLDFEGGGTEFVSSADGFIFPRDNGEDGMTGRQFFEHYRRKIGGPHEDESQLAHSSLRSLHLDV